ncbi:DNA polymerase-3 subunit beta [Ancylobacter sp. 3268]|nr:DNA polymerase-3 subunit beta [Ancylobacter sp. 3268]
MLAMVMIKATKGGASIIGTDLDLYTTTFVPGTVTSDFTVLVDAHRLKATLDKVKDAATINFAIDDAALVTSIGKLNLSLHRGLDASEFPLEAAFRTALGTSNCSFVLPAATIAAVLDKVSFAVSTEETRYYLNGIYMHVDEHEQKLCFVATDGHRAALYKVDVPAGAGALPDAGIIIPRKTVAELHRMVSRNGRAQDAMVTAAEKGVSFLVGEDELLESKAIDGTFPDYGRVIPTSNRHRVGIPSAPLIDAIRQASSIMSEKSRRTSLSFSPGRLVVSCSSPEFGTASTEVRITSDFELSIGFNAGYLMQLLGQLDGGAMLEIDDPSGPAVIKDGADPAITYAQMPMRI